MQNKEGLNLITDKILYLGIKTTVENFRFGQQELSIIFQMSFRGRTPKLFSYCLKRNENGGGILVFGKIWIRESYIVPLLRHITYCYSIMKFLFLLMTNIEILIVSSLVCLMLHDLAVLFLSS